MRTVFLYTNQRLPNFINKQRVSEVDQGVWKTEMSPGDLVQDYPGCLQHKKEEMKLTRSNTVSPGSSSVYPLEFTNFECLSAR